MPLLHRADDLLLVVRAGQHVGGAHARQRRVAVALAPPVAGGRDLVVAGRDGVVQVGGEHAVLHQHGAAGRVALVVHVDRAARAGLGAVVDDGDERGGHDLAQLVGVDGGALAVEVGLHAVADGLVEQDPRATRRPAPPASRRRAAGRPRRGWRCGPRPRSRAGRCGPSSRSRPRRARPRCSRSARAARRARPAPTPRAAPWAACPRPPGRSSRRRAPRRLVVQVDVHLAYARVGGEQAGVHRLEDRQARRGALPLPRRERRVAPAQARGQVQAGPGRRAAAPSAMVAAVRAAARMAGSERSSV